jgi:hypothetical protein
MKSLYKQQAYTSSSAYSRFGTITFMVAEKRVISMTLKPQFKRLKPTANIGLESVRKTITSETLRAAKVPGRSS